MSKFVTQVVNNRFKLISSTTEVVQTSFSESVKHGFTSGAEKFLEPKYFYDQEGSLIFEEITQLQEYYPTRCEASILFEKHREITKLFANVDEPIMVELGSGSSVKTKTLIKSILEQKGKLLYIPIDISETMLRESANQLLEQFPALKVVGVAAEYTQGLHILATEYSQRTKLVLWLGSSIGNMLRTESYQFLSAVKKAMTPMDRLLIGMDLKKDIKTLLAAYNDSLGVTARFNKNLLLRINEELDANFNLDKWRHESIWNSKEGRIEMRLWSEVDQSVLIPKLDNLTLHFVAGESIHTENCHKYSQEDIESTASKSGFEVDEQWFDKGNMFSLNLFEPLFSSS